jgi:O-antigen ligase
MTTLAVRSAFTRSGPPKIWVAAGLGAVVAGAFAAMHPSLGLLFLIALSLGVAMLVRPDVTTYVVVFLVIINAPSVLVNTYGMPATVGAIVPMMLAIPFAAVVLRREPIVLTRVLFLLILYFVVQLIGTSLSIDTSVSLHRVQTFIFEGIVIFFLVTNVVRTPAQLRNVTWVVAGSTALLGALTLFQDVTHRYYSTFGGFARTSDDFFYGQVTSPRFQGPIGDPNYFGQILMIGVPLGFMLAATERAGLKRKLAVACTGLTVAGIVLTYSRGAVVALAFVLIGLVLLRHVKAHHLLVFVIALTVVVLSIPSYRARVTSIGSVKGASAEAGSTQASSDQSVRARSTEMRAALLAVSDHPIFGLGPSAFPLNYQHYALQVGGEIHEKIKFGAKKGQTPERQAHDIFLSVAADLGLVGLSLFLAMIAMTFRGLSRARRFAMRVGDAAGAGLTSGYLLALVGFLTTGLFLSLAYERYYWLLLALAVAAGRIPLLARGQPATAAAATAEAPVLAPAPRPRPAAVPPRARRRRPVRAPVSAAVPAESAAPTIAAGLSKLLTRERTVQLIALVGLTVAAVFALRLLVFDHRTQPAASPAHVALASNTPLPKTAAAAPGRRKLMRLSVVGTTDWGARLEIRDGSRTGRVLFRGDLATGERVDFTRRRLWVHLRAATHLDVAVNGRRIRGLNGTLDVLFTPSGLRQG